MMKTWARLSGVAAVACVTVGCAHSVPQVQKLGEPAETEWVRQGNLVGHIRCELGKAVWDVLKAERPPNQVEPELSAAWLKKWGASVTLQILVDEKASVAPGLTFNNPMRNVIRKFPSGGNVTASQSQNTGVGGAYNTGATRKETISFFYSFEELILEKEEEEKEAKRLGIKLSEEPCATARGQQMEGDLRIAEFMNSKILASRVPGLHGRKPGASPFTTFTYEISFAVTTTGSLNPSWKLVYLSANPTGPLLSGSRAKTNTMIMTMGPAGGLPGGPSGPSKEVQDAQQAALIGQAVAAALREK